MTADEAFEAMDSVGNGTRRSDEISVVCASVSERDSVVAAARGLLKRGFVAKVAAGKSVRDLTVIITFK